MLKQDIQSSSWNFFQLLSRVPQQDAPMPEIIETCLLMETENLPIAFDIIAQAQSDDKKTSRNSQ